MSDYFLAYSNDPAVCRYSSSGGFVKELLAAALRTGWCQKTIFPRLRGTSAEVVVTDDPAELFTPAANSIYQPIWPPDGLARLAPGETCAITLLPCAFDRPRPDQIALAVELLCDHVPRIDYTHGLLRAAGVTEDRVAEFFYRAGTWPGMTTIVLKDGRRIQRHFTETWTSDLDLARPGCRNCGRLARGGDVLVGDPWRLMQPYGGDPGKTLVSVRNPAVHSLLERANITIEPIDEAAWRRATAPHWSQKQRRSAK